MFDFKKTIVLSVIILATVLDFIAGFTVGRMIGYTECKEDNNEYMYGIIMRQDSIMAKQTEFCHRIMDGWFESKQAE